MLSGSHHPPCGAADLKELRAAASARGCAVYGKAMNEGLVFDIKEFAVFDGPGVRTTVFMKGCPLRCAWCHNPEGLSPKPQLMVSRAACTHCGACKRVCPSPGKCNACGKCLPVCRSGLRKIVGEAWRAEDLARRLQKDADVYALSGGGVTFSGGEPLFQGAFLLEVLDALPDVHTAIETSGYCTEELFRQAVARLDFVLMDLKLADPEEHRRYTGVSNGPILRNLCLLQQSGVPFRIRIPLIPGVSDTRENLEASAQLLAGCPTMECVELLPYHLTAGAKYAMLNMAYCPDFPVEQPVQTHPGLFESYGIRSQVL